MQAVAIQDEMDIIAMHAGMFWLLCRLAANAAESGVFPSFEGPLEARWNPAVERSVETPRTLLGEGVPFDWKSETTSWIAYPERQILFLAILSVLFRFVTYHEAGHLWYDHGRRRGGRDRASIFVDKTEPREAGSVGAIASQAREIIADSFALERTIKVIDRELTLKAEFEMTKILRAKLLPDQKAIAGFVLTMVFIYFRVSDRSNWHSASLHALSHPPAPFRAKAIAAALFEHRHLSISEDAAGSAIRSATAGSEAILSVMLGIYPNLHWLENVSTTEFDDHFKKIYDEIPQWC
ncbi:hypothetical protein MK632_33580 [Rhizobium changzhiense]|uniref:hypothetical protein n=1 Tax=Rhizobium TaxID=379 RepID=UPI001F0B9488|nr:MULTISPECIES: hypothetical protein [Rhizobium]MCH4550638.1 hypothetical protein [Rhizobium changzhiense]MCW0020046.1 hypothetical protein [Rhizobium sp. BT-226]